MFVEGESAANDVRNALQSNYNIEVNQRNRFLPKVKMFDLDPSLYSKDSTSKLKEDILANNRGLRKLHDSDVKYSLDVVIISTY